MDATAQRALAARVANALDGARIEIGRPRQAGREHWVERADYVAVLGAIYHAGYIVRDLDAAPPARPPRLIVFPRKRRVS